MKKRRKNSVGTSQMFYDSKYQMNELSDDIIKVMSGAGNPEYFSLYLDRYIKYSTTRDICK